MKCKDIYSKERFIKKKISSKSIPLPYKWFVVQSDKQSSCVNNPTSGLYHAGCEGNTDIHPMTFSAVTCVFLDMLKRRNVLCIGLYGERDSMSEENKNGNGRLNK